MVDADGLDDLTDAHLDRVCDFLLDTCKNRIEREIELIFPDAEIVAVEMDMEPDTPVTTRITVRGVNHCPRLTADRIDLVERIFGPNIKVTCFVTKTLVVKASLDRIFGPEINVTVADDIPVSNGFVLVATPRIKKSDADDEC